MIEAFKSTLESAINCDLALVVCDATGEYEMQMQTTLDTLKEMQFASPYLVVMNKCEDIKDLSSFPHDCLTISAKERLGIDGLKRAILKQFSDEYLFCSLSIPYTQINEYVQIKCYLKERQSQFQDDAQIIDVVIPARYVHKFEKYIVERKMDI